jgi:hypothetical protein
VTDRTILTYSWFEGDRPVCHLFLWEVDFLKRAFEQVRGVTSNRTSDGGKESIAASRSRSRSKD